MGFAHLLIRLGVPYDDPKAESTGEKIISVIQEESKVASKRLADERGPFPNFKGSLWDKRNLIQRNATTTTIAPTGTLSIIGGTSSGIEPIFDISYKRLLLGGIEVQVDDPLWQEIKDRLDAIEKLEKLFRRAYQVAPLAHLRIQRTFQNHVDNAVSKTINLPETATPEDILTIYLGPMAWGSRALRFSGTRAATIRYCRAGPTRSVEAPRPRDVCTSYGSRQGWKKAGRERRIEP